MDRQRGRTSTQGGRGDSDGVLGRAGEEVRAGEVLQEYQQERERCGGAAQSSEDGGWDDSRADDIGGVEEGAERGGVGVGGEGEVNISRRQG